MATRLCFEESRLVKSAAIRRARSTRSPNTTLSVSVIAAGAFGVSMDARARRSNGIISPQSFPDSCVLSLISYRVEAAVGREAA
jgi:hypothetical protein